MRCPICSANSWNQTGDRYQKITDVHWQSGYPKIQKAVFFKIWHPNKKIVKMERCVCKRCGFVLDLPRPSQKDVNNQFEYLTIVEKYLGTSKNLSQKAMAQEHKQSIDILQLAENHLKPNSKKLQILDCGGGDGHFLIPMLKKNHQCYLVDYNRFTRPGIIYLGNTINDISSNYKFDLIICRHVLEHVASPKEMVCKFISYLKKNGLVYGEVPIELDETVKPNPDPVTHLNYFQQESFRIMFELAGLHPIVLRTKSTTYHEDYNIVVQILARKRSESKNVFYRNSYKKTMFLIKPPFIFRLLKYLKRNIRQPKKILKVIIEKLK
jgi:ubiquinone/menaquinone biosynthesis C-methylase UbiE